MKDVDYACDLRGNITFEYVTRKNDYKNNLPLWSSINNNCYIKLKENDNET